MFDLRNIDALAKSLSQGLPADAKALSDEIRGNLDIAVSAALRRMNLVTREEFDAQSALLQRTRMKLEQLSDRLAELESRSTHPD